MVLFVIITIANVRFYLVVVLHTQFLPMSFLFCVSVCCRVYLVTGGSTLLQVVPGNSSLFQVVLARSRWFQAHSRWFQLVSDGPGLFCSSWFQVVPARSLFCYVRCFTLFLLEKFIRKMKFKNPKS